ncbi:hypothetical protein PUW21_12540 [Bacillus subtilis]|uniref:hypothetical protein n=3 Tax=Bacteria TaxID=2 RepID=UPI002367DE45|nr:hypothetical protein [Bacillus subtilis]WDI23835.1 hypothetical protein PUW21_12540 [Bacillus subtilis]
MLKEATIRLMVHPKQYSTKPSKEETAFINNTVLKNPVTITVKDLADSLSSGQSIVTSYLHPNKNTITRSEQFWKSQQFVALDFDNEKFIIDKNKKRVKIKDIRLTWEDAQQNSFFNQYAAFAYKTFNFKEDHPKFRVCFIFEQPFLNLDKCKETINRLLELFPMADPISNQGNRLFYGGTDLHVFNYENTLPIDPTLWLSIYSYNLLYLNEGSKPKSTNRHKKIHIDIKDKNKISGVQINKNRNLNLIKNLDAHSLANIVNSKSIELHNLTQINDYIKKQDLRTFLGVSSSTFHDIFHEEQSPSASVYKSNTGSGHWLYKCHSASFPFCGTIFEVVEKLTGLTRLQVKNFLMEVFKITLKESELQMELKAEIDEYKYILQSPDFREMYPNAFKLLNKHRYIDDFYIILDLAKQNLSGNIHDKRKLFFHSLKTIAESLGRSEPTTSSRITFFVFLKMLCKLNDDEIPDKILKIQKKNQRKNKFKRRNTMYEIRDYSSSLFQEIDNRCKEWNEKGLTTKSMNREGIYRNFGKAEADRVFPQDKNTELPQLHDDVVKQLTVTLNKLVQLKGWTTEKEVTQETVLFFKGQKQLKSDLIKKSIGGLLDSYSLKKISCTKKIKEQYGITEDDMPKSSFPKLIIKY